MGADPAPAVMDELRAVRPPDPLWAERAGARQARLTMPQGSLGRLLELGRLLASIQRTDRPVAEPSLVAVFAADHGIAREGVSAFPQEVTGQMVGNFLAGGAAINVLARRAGAAVRVVDLGVAGLSQELRDHPSLESRPIRAGTSSFLDGPAMTRSEAFLAVSTGLELAERWVAREGFKVVALGEMGIGNTTTASALIAALTGSDPLAVVGRGTGIDDAGLARKRSVIERAIALHRPRVIDTWDWLACVGGFEILGLAGLAIGAARHGATVVVDGLISGAAALGASTLCPDSRGYMVAAHMSTEPGARVVLEALGLRPLLDLGLRLGEGSGAALALPILAAAADILRDMATFDSAGVAGPAESDPT